MAQFVISTDLDPVTVQAFGNWFSFKPSQIKSMAPNLIDFLTMEKRNLGFVAIPDIYGDDPQSPEVKEAVTNAIKEGRRNIIKELEFLRHNLEVSLQKDYDGANIKVSTIEYEGKAHLPIYRKLARFQADAQAAANEELDELKALRSKINGDTVSTNTSSVDKGSSDNAKPARSK